MNTIRPLQLGFNLQVIEQNHQFHFVASVSQGVNLQTGEPLLEFDCLKAAFECMGAKPLPDAGMPKPCGEFLVSGSYFAPNRQPVTGGEVMVKIGSREKRLFLFGPRTWTHGLPSKPEPVVSLPLDYGHAFGGAGYNQNPDGIGYKDGRLPCIENPAELVTSPKDTPEPAGFSPMDPSRPQRMQFQARYGSDYKEKYFPGYPPDFDWHYFLCAPKDQWVEGFLKGNEPFEIHHMHPDVPLIKGNLPGLYPRCFVRHTINASEPEFTELVLNLDTIWFFPEKMTALLIWRRCLRVGDDEAEQISHVLLGYEDRSHTPRTIEHYCNALERRLRSKDPLLNHFNTEDLIPPGHTCAMQLLQEMALPDSQKGEFEKNINAKIDSIKKIADEKLEEAVKTAEKQMTDPGIPLEAKVDIRKMAAGQSPAKPDADAEMMKLELESIIPGITGGDTGKIELKNFSFDKIDQIMDTVGDFSEKKRKEAMEIAKAEIAKAKEQINAQMSQDILKDLPEESRSKLENSLQQLEAIDLDGRKPPLVPLPRLNAEEMIGQISQMTPQIMEALQHLQSMKAMGGENDATQDLEKQIQETMTTQDEQIKKGLREAQKPFKEAYILGAHFMAKGLSPHKTPVEEVTDRLLKAIAAKETVADKDWACIDLSGKNLDGVDLHGAFLEQVNFKGASLKGANLSEAVLARANLEDADFSGANLEKANIGAVQALGARFTGANLRSAKLSKGDFTGADFTKADLEDIESLEFIITGADFTSAHMPKVNFMETRVINLKFINTDLSSSVFIKCNIDESDFSSSLMSGCVFVDSELHRTSFENADLSKVCFVAAEPGKSGMKNLNFKHTCLHQANFQNMDLQHSDLTYADIENAYFGGADLSNADLSYALAKNAQFRKAKLTNAKLDNINLDQGSLAKANLVGASFVGANLHAVDFLRSTITKTDFRKANLDTTLIEHWRPE